MIKMVDIARMAGVSPATVSLVLNPRDSSVRVGDATREKVLRIAAEMGYAQNEIARAMVTGRTRIIGWLAPSYEAESMVRMIAGAVAEADARGYFLKLLHGRPDQIEQIDQTCRSHRLCGVICVGAAMAPSLLFRMLDSYRQGRLGGMVVLGNSPCDEAPAHVCSDDVGGVRSGWEHLRALGHRSIGFLGGPEYERNFALRRSAYEELQASCGAGSSAHVASARAFDSVALTAAAERLLQSRRRPTGVLCASDWHAATLVRVALRQGLCLPDQLSIVGFANLSFSEMTCPSLTTVAQPFEEKGRRSVAAILEQLERPDAAQTGSGRILLATPLVVRESTGEPGAIGSKCVR